MIDLTPNGILCMDEWAKGDLVFLPSGEDNNIPSPALNEIRLFPQVPRLPVRCTSQVDHEFGLVAFPNPPE